MRQLCALMLVLALLLISGGTARADLIGIPIHQHATVPSGTFDNMAGGTFSDPYVIAGAGGHDLWGGQENIYQVYDDGMVSGDFEITARARMDISGGGWSRAGLVIRETLNTGSMLFAASIADAGNRLTAGHRDTTNAGMHRHEPDAYPNLGLGPFWLKITRVGDVFTSLYSGMDTDDVSAVTDWAMIGTGSDAERTISMAGDVYVGFQAHGRSNNNVNVTTASFWNLGGALIQSDGDLNSITSGFWDVASTWGGTVPGGVPTDLSLVTIDDTSAVADVVTVRDMTSVAKELTIRDASSLVIQAGQRLTVDGTVTANGTGPIAFEAGAQLVAGGGSIATVTTSGSNTLDVGGSMSVGTWTDSATAGTFTKAGGGMLTLDNTGGTIDLDNTSLRISGGTLAFRDGPAPLGGAVQPVQLDGGTFQITGLKDPTPVPAFPNITGLQLRLDASAITGLADGDIVDVWADSSGKGYDAANRWNEPKYVADGVNGMPVVQFTNDTLHTSHDFDDLTEYSVLSVARYTGGDNERILGSTTHNWLFGFHGNGVNEWHAEGWIYNGTVTDTDWHLHAGTINNDADPLASFWDNGVNLVTDNTGSGAGNHMIGQLALGGWRANSETSNSEIAEVLVYEGVLSESDRNDLSYYLQQKYAIGPIEPIVMTDTDFTVTQDSTINAVTDATASFGSLTLQNGIVTTTGALGGVSFTGTTIAPAATRVGVGPDVTTDYGNALSGHPGLTFALGGSGDKTLAAAYTNPGDLALANMTGATIEVAQGTTRVDNPALLAGSTNVLLSGGSLHFAPPVAVPSVDPGAVTAGMVIRFDADNGVTTDAAGVATWANTAPGADSTYDAMADGTGVAPIWVDNAFNGNAVVRFDGTNQQRLSFMEYFDMESAIWVLRESEDLDAAMRPPLLGDDDYYPFNRQVGRGPMVGGWSSPEVRGGAAMLNAGQIDQMVEPPPTEMGILGLVLTGPLTQQDAHLGPSNGIPTGVSQIGQDRDVDGRSWDGDFADIIIYDTQLTAAQVFQMTQHLAYRYGIPVDQAMEDFSGVDMTVTADSTLQVGGLEDVSLASLTLRGGTLTTTGSASSISFTGVTVNVDPASDLEAGLNPLTATTYGAGPLQLQHGVIRTAGSPVTFNGVNIPATATAVGFNPEVVTTYGTIQGNNTSAVISKTGPGTLVLNPGDVVNLNSNATLDAQGGILALGGSGAFAGTSNALLSGGTMRIHAGAIVEGTGLHAGLTGAWLFDEGSGSVAGDSTFNGDGAITGAAWVNDPIRGMVLDFEGNDEVLIPGGPFATVGDAVTVSLWQYGDVDIQPQNNTIFQAQMTGVTTRAFGSHLPWSNSEVYWDAGGASGCCNDRINRAVDFDGEFEGEWNHWVFTKDTNTGEQKMYLNGFEWHSGTGMVRSLAGVDQMFIGSEGNVNFYDGMIDEFLLYDRALDADEVTDLHNNGITFAALPAISMTDKHFTVTADSGLVAASSTTAAFGNLTLEGGTIAIGGAPGGVSFNSLTVNAPDAEGGVNLQTSATFGAGPVALQAGVLKTEGLPVTFNGVDIPVGATAVGLNPISETTYGGIDGNLMSGTVAKTGPGTLSLASGDATAMTNATWAAQDGTLEMVGAASWAGSTKANLAGGTMVLTDVEAAVTPIDPGTIGSIQLRLDAGQIGLADGGTVDVWPDSSGMGHNAENRWNDPKYTANGLNGLPVVTFTNDVLSTTHNFNSLAGYTIMTVARYTGGDNERIFGSMDRNWLFGYHGAGVTDFHADGWVYDGPGNADTEWHLHVGTMTNDADPKGSFWMDGNNLVTDSTGSHNTNYRMDRLALGGWRDNNQTSNSQIAEALIFEGVLTEEQIHGIGIFLAQRYDLDTEYRGEIAALNLTDRDFTVTADSTLNARTDFTAALGTLTLQEGVATITGAPGGVSFLSTTLPASAGTSGITAETEVAGGPLTINAGVLRTRGPVSFDTTTIPGTATAVGFDADASTDLGVISGAGAGHQVAVSKVGPGMLALTQTNTGLQDATWVAGGGTLRMATPGAWGGSKTATLAGGTIQIMGDPLLTPNRINETIWDAALPNGDVTDNIENVRAATGSLGANDAQGVLTSHLHYQDDNSVSNRAAALGAVGFDNGNFTMLWETEFTPNEDGDWGFRNNNVDDRYSFWIDLDQNGTLQSTERFWVRPNCCAGSGDRFISEAGSAIDSLTAGETYTLGLVMNDTGGGGYFRDMEFKSPSGVWTDLNPGDGAQNGLWSAQEFDALAMTDYEFTVTKNSTLNATTAFDAAFGPLTVNNGVLTTSGAPDGISFTSTTIDPNALKVGFNPMTGTSLGPLDGSNAAVTISKTGAGDLVLSDAGSNLGNATFSAAGGRLITVGTSPIGDAALQTAGGELVLSAPTGSTSPVLYDYAITGAGGTLTAGKGGQAGTADAPMTVQVGSAGVNDVTVADGDSLRLRSTDGYTLDIVGNVNSEGEIVVEDAGSMVVLSGPSTAINLLSVAGGTTTLAGANASVGTMTVTGGTVDTAGNDVGVGSLTLVDHGYEVAGSTMAVRGPDLLSDASVIVGAGGTLSISGTMALPVGNPLAYYSFNDAGNVTNDDSGNGYTGTLIAPAAADGDGKFGGALFLNTGGARQGQMRVNPTGINLDLEVADHWTVAGWYLNLAPVGDWRTFMRGHGADHHIIVQNNADNLGSYVGGFRPNNATLTTDPDVWHHIAAVGDSGGTTIYLDGAQIGDKIAFRAQDNVYAIGGYQNNSQRFADKLDEIVIYGRALSPAEVADLMDPPAESVEQESTSLVITGNATVTTTAAEAVLGNLTVAAGVTTLDLQTAAYEFANATIADGATVDGSWVVGGTLNIGNSAGTMTVGDGMLSLTGATTSNVEISLAGIPDGPNMADKIEVSSLGTLVLGGTLAPAGIDRTDTDMFGDATRRIINNPDGAIGDSQAGTGFEYDGVDPLPGTSDASHIGQGAFLRAVTYVTPFPNITTGVDLDLFVAWGGDADGDKMVFLSDWGLLRTNFSNTGSGFDWTDANFDPWVDDKVFLSDWGLLRARFANADYTLAEAGDLRGPQADGIALAAEGLGPEDRMTLVVRLDLADENGAPLQLVGRGAGAVTTVQFNSPGGHLIPAENASAAPFDMFLGQNTPVDITIASMFTEVDFGAGEQVIDLGFRVDVNADDINGVWMDPANHQIPYAVEYVPEPGTIAMLLSGLVGLVLVIRRRRAA